jgi:hypothetical protein
MRIGQNPAKFIEHVPKPARVTVAVVSFIPFLNGYYAGSLDVLKVCLNSIWQNTRVPFDLMIFDNASCQEVRAYLLDCQQSGKIQYLILSDKNIGKGGAWNFVFQGAPGEVIAYSDSDVCVFPGWLEKSLEILDAFPRTGMVTARPLSTPEALYSSTLEWARHNPAVKIENERFLAWEDYRDHLVSLGTSEVVARDWYEGGFDWRLTFEGVQAQIGAAHFQFTAQKSVLGEFLPFEMNRPMGQVRSLDEQMNAAGYLRLTTCQPLVRHLGNQLTDGELSEKPAQKKSSLSQARPDKPRRVRPLEWVHPLVDLPFIKRILLKIYDAIFRLYYH